MTGNIAHSQPALKERTWPNLDDYLRSSKFYLNEIEEVFKNEELKNFNCNRLGIFRKKIDNWKKEKTLMQFLLFV